MPQPGPDAENIVYDWRIGVPALLQTIGIRLQVIAAMDRTFKKNSRFQREMTELRSYVANHYTTMMDGVRCGFRRMDDSPQYDRSVSVWRELACVDVYSGTAAYASMSADCWDTTGSYCTWDEGAVDAQMDFLRGQVMLRMPLFEMRSMMDTLYLYAKDLPDLTTTFGDIRVAAASSLCLDVTPAGLGIVLQPCNWDRFGQFWLYDRKNGEIGNPVSGKCLDVQWGSTSAATPVWLWECHGGLAQRWTWDPERKVLENALGKTLDVQWGNLQAGTPVWMWWRNEGNAQRWH